jgi:hypothetical protein
MKSVIKSVNPWTRTVHIVHARRVYQLPASPIIESKTLSVLRLWMFANSPRCITRPTCPAWHRHAPDRCWGSSQSSSTRRPLLRRFVLYALRGNLVRSPSCRNDVLYLEIVVDPDIQDLLFDEWLNRLTEPSMRSALPSP